MVRSFGDSNGLGSNMTGPTGDDSGGYAVFVAGILVVAVIVGAKFCDWQHFSGGSESDVKHARGRGMAEVEARKVRGP